MSDVRQVAIDGVEVRFTQRPFATPLLLSSGAITGLTEVEAAVTVRAGSRSATGRGSIFLSDLWAWPGGALDHDGKDRALRAMCEAIARDLHTLTGGEAAHPLTLGLRLHDAVMHGFDDVDAPLARAMCASPFDAAIHDAVGRALGCSAFALYEDDAPLPGADEWLDGHATKAVREMILPQPRRAFDAWWVVGKNDDLHRDVRPAAERFGYRHFKLKLMGADNDADAARTAAVHRAFPDATLIVDSNEANPDAASVLNYLHRLRDMDAGAFAALQYLEQPTGRDITRHAFDWRAVTQLKPVMLDEGLTDLSLLPLAAEQGWSGLAMKTCKGHSFALVAAAWARRHGMAVSLQDLTNPGCSYVHAALFAAHVPTINGVELNCAQFAPEAVGPAGERLQPVDGTHRLDGALPNGLGSSWR